MPRPFKRVVRQLADGSYANSGHGGYVSHPNYARDGWHYKRGFQIIDADLQEIFTYVEPADANAPCFSHKIAGLLTRTCIEVEANFKAIMKENGYPKAPSKLNMVDYAKIEHSHRLSAYRIKFPIWTGSDDTYCPFESWSVTQGQMSPDWYKAYNAAKHDRHENFSQSATFGNLITAYCALSVLIWAQFRGADSPGPIMLSLESTPDDPGYDFGPMGRTLIKPPEFPANERYDFDWRRLRTESDPFDCYAY